MASRHRPPFSCMSARLRKSSVAALTASLLAALGLGLWLGGHPDDLPGFLRNTFVADHQQRLIDLAAQRISRDYYRPIPQTELVNSSIAGMVSQLHDRF